MAFNMHNRNLPSPEHLSRDPKRANYAGTEQHALKDMQSGDPVKPEHLE